MDTFALGLINAAKIIEDGRIDEFKKTKYSSFERDIGLKIINNETNLKELSDYALKLGFVANPGSGKQERLESIINQVLFSVK